MKCFLELYLTRKEQLSYKCTVALSTRPKEQGEERGQKSERVLSRDRGMSLLFFFGSTGI
jgi:hypothetical protein